MTSFFRIALHYMFQCAFPYRQEFLSSCPTAQWGTQGRYHYHYFTEKETENKTHTLSELMELINSTASGISTLIGWMCSPHCLEMLLAWWEITDSAFLWCTWRKQVSVPIHSGVWTLPCSPRALHTITHLNHPRSSFFKKTNVWAPPRESHPTELEWGSGICNFYKFSQEILICNHKWKQLASRP